MDLYRDKIEMALWNLTHRLGWKDFLDILIVAVILYEVIMLTRQTRSSALLKGLVLVAVFTLISNMMGLTALRWLMDALLQNGAVVLIIVIQPELRKALEQIGRGAKIDMVRGRSAEEQERIISEIIQCLTNLSRRRVGALIVFERKVGLKDVIDTGTALDADISAPLLENIFEPNTPLHDGAVIIRGDRVVAGACIIQALTESRAVARELGTRHRAAIGVSEATDALVLIVSEETGIISMAKEGRITRHLDAKSLREVLGEMYAEPQHRLRMVLSSLRRKEDAK